MVIVKKEKAAERKRMLEEGYLPVMEAFYTLQGEGYHAGKAAYFIRLAGCDIGCHWCDVKESWVEENHPLKSPVEIVKEAKKFPTKMVVITGGEPLLYNLDELTDRLHKAGFKVHLETSGAYPFTGEFEWITLSPKKFKFPVEKAYKVADELKVIVFNSSDFKWAEQEAFKSNQNCKLFLQPEWGKVEVMLPEIVEFVKVNPKWQISLQTHKYMNIP
jgi:7-carboxy-7-deazaguanine synthase